jgi:hypothetical protein
MATPLLSYTTSANISMKSILTITRQAEDPLVQDQPEGIDSRRKWPIS